MKENCFSVKELIWLATKFAASIQRKNSPNTGRNRASDCYFILLVFQQLRLAAFIASAAAAAYWHW